MNVKAYQSKNIRAFIGAKDYEVSKRFYKALGFEALEIGHDMTFFEVNDTLGFYLQDYYVKDWINNSMVFLEVDDVDKCWEDLRKRALDEEYKNVKLSPIKTFDHGRQCFLHDPSGVLWHFCQFN